MTKAAPPSAIARAIPAGSVPLISVEGTAYDCGAEYARIVNARYPGYREYLDMAHGFRESLTGQVARLVEQRAPFVADLYRGLTDADTPGPGTSAPARPSECTSFSVSGGLTLDGALISGQNKDTPAERAMLYIVLRMRITEGPTILVLAYPGEVLGYGMWSTGMSVFRNNLHSTAGSENGLSMAQWGLLALAGSSADDAAELARKYGMSGSGNCLISDVSGRSLSVEFNTGGVSVVPAREGISTHANHPVGEQTAPHECFPDKIEQANSRYRMETLWELLDAERGRLTAQKALMCLAHHGRYPLGVCRHVIGGSTRVCTTAAVVAEPAQGRLHVVRGNPCCNWAATYTL